MATNYQILRTEFGTGKNGRKEFFVDLQITDDELGLINYPMWHFGNEATQMAETAVYLESKIDEMIPAILDAKRSELEANND